MDDNHQEIIKKYLAVVKEINHPLNIIGYETDNGKRLIRRVNGGRDDGKYYLALDAKLNVIEMNFMSLFSSPLNLILSYFEEQPGAIVTDIIFFDDIGPAFYWLTEV